MFEGAFSPLHWLLVLLIVLIIFGPRKLPEVGKGLGSAIRGFREALRGDEGHGQPPTESKPSETSKPTLVEGSGPKT